jgi:hypothetical protein
MGPSIAVPPARQNLCAEVLAFERPSTGISDPDAADSLPAIPNLALCCCKSGAEEAHYRLACKAINEHGRIGNTERSVGKQLKRPAPLCAEMTFSRQAGHLSNSMKNLGKSINRSAEKRRQYRAPIIWGRAPLIGVPGNVAFLSKLWLQQRYRDRFCWGRVAYRA